MTLQDEGGQFAVFIGIATKCMAVVAGLGIIGLLIISMADLLSRYFWSRSIAGVVEYVEVGLAAIVFLGMGRALRQGTHVATPMVTSRLGLTLAASIRLLGNLIVVAFLTWMVIVNAERAWDSFQADEIRMGLAEVPVWPARICITVGLLGLALEFIVVTYGNARTLLARRGGRTTVVGELT